MFKQSQQTHMFRNTVWYTWTNLFSQNLDPSTHPPARGGVVIIWIPLSLPPVTDFSFLLNQL